MTYYEYCRVKNNKIVNTKNNTTVRVINVILHDGSEQPIWINNLEEHKHIQAGQSIKALRNAKGGLTIVENEPPRNVNGNGLKPVGEVIPNVVDDLLDELPILSETDKKKLSIYIQQNSKLLKYCCDCVAKEFPDIDDKSARSLGITIFINAQQAINKHL